MKHRVYIHRVKVINFRLLSKVELVLENEATLIVGRNNSGKTSLSEVIRRFLSGNGPKFQIEDFSSSCCEGFCAALKAKNDGKEEAEIRTLIPSIEVRIHFRYDPASWELGALSNFIVDLDPNCNEALVVLRYELRDGAIGPFFEGQPTEDLTTDTRLKFFRALRERIPNLFSTKVWAQDPTDPANRRAMTQPDVRALVRTAFVNAQRGLDDITSRDTDVLARILEGLFSTAASPTADADDQMIAAALEEAVKDIQQTIDSNFAGNLKSLMPTLETFGYPGLGGPELQTETTLDVKRLLSNHTKVRYAGYGGISLPESYNGLGTRNLIFILLQLVGFYKTYRAELHAPGVHLIFIEEPEAHLHPQMQEVFIRQLEKLATQLNAMHPNDSPWPVQFIVSTHSSHIANEVGFEKIRYFLAKADTESPDVRKTAIKDLREGLGATPVKDKQFLRQYLTLTRCDLFFADKAVLVEGTTERLLLPVIIRKLEEASPTLPKLSSQYMTVMEVGGAYAHIFFDLLNFLELQTLIITDLDAVSGVTGEACPVHDGSATSNACLKSWFGPSCTLSELQVKTDPEKIKGRQRIAYQQPEIADGPCGRSFEDAFILANDAKFAIAGGNTKARAHEAFKKAGKVKKSEFALKYAIDDTQWVSPRYIVDGVKWLAAADLGAAAGALSTTLPAPLQPVTETVQQSVVA